MKKKNRDKKSDERLFGSHVEDKRYARVGACSSCPKSLYSLLRAGSCLGCSAISPAVEPASFSTTSDMFRSRVDDGLGVEGRKFERRGGGGKEEKNLRRGEERRRGWRREGDQAKRGKILNPFYPFAFRIRGINRANKSKQECRQEKRRAVFLIGGRGVRSDRGDKA